MAVTPTYPGVYVQEVPSGVRAIAGVSTSIGMFIGRAADGPINVPVRCPNYTKFQTTFSDQYANSDLARAVRLFFDNGGTDCYVMRIAGGPPAQAQVELRTEGNPTGPPPLSLRVRAKAPGLKGNSTRVAVTYSGPDPDAEFNLVAFRWQPGVGGALTRVGEELWQRLSMDPNSPRYVETVVNQGSALVEVEDISPGAAGNGISRSGRPIPFSGTGTNGAEIAFRNAMQALIGNGTATTIRNSFQISVDGRPFNDIDLSNINFGVAPLDAANVANIVTELAAAIRNEINPQLTGGAVTVDFAAGPDADPGTATAPTLQLRILSAAGDVKIAPAGDPNDDLASSLMLGPAQGGIETSRFSGARPAPTGVVFKDTSLVAFAGRAQNAFNVFDVAGTPVQLGTSLQTLPSPATKTMFQDNLPNSPNGNNDGVREKFGILADAVRAEAQANPAFAWRAEVWGSRLALLPTGGADNLVGTVATSGAAGDNITNNFYRNARYYTGGPGGLGDYQANAVAGTDGTKPLLADYRSAFDVIDREVDMFNLMVLPTDAQHTDAERRSLLGATSNFCKEQRAFLLIDAPPAWRDESDATAASTGVNSLRVGLVKDHSALFFPRVMIPENGSQVAVGPSGAIAGLMARIDGTRGVWKAPAGTEAYLSGVVGLEHQFSDAQNGVMNPRAVNTLRVFPSGIVNWGARTMDGDNDFGSEYKYIPIRRLALYMEESLYRGLKWVVFEPNDEPLWAQIRLNVGAFMHDLFRKGAFEGSKPKDAYFVKCDGETTTANDRNLGVVNIWVGFAPLKPAEFVVLYLQQMAAQAEV
jgi:phage tail sheath protein FI